MQGIRDSLSVRLARHPPQPASASPDPAVGLLLQVDRSYREQARRGALPQIAPRRFNPEGEAWLPILHDTFGDWEITALFSNTARAHELGKTRDWVVIYAAQRESGRRYQGTIISASTGELRGRRVVRGREAETWAHYAEGGAGRVRLTAGPNPLC